MLARALGGPCLALCAVVPALAQSPEFTYRQGGHSHGIQFWTDDDGVVVEDGGRIRYTGDGGDTWIDAEVSDEYRDDFRGVFVVPHPSQDAWAVGVGGHVFKTTDRGETWDRLTELAFDVPAPVLDKSSNPAELYDIWMLDEDEGWVVGLDGVLQYTDDGGVTWQDGHPSGNPPPILDQPNAGDFDDFYDIVFIDANIAIAPADWGRVYRTTNGGLDWASQSVSGDGEICFTDLEPVGEHPYLELWSAAFVPGSSGSSAEGWMVGGINTNGGQLYHTTDSGATWEVVSDFLPGAWSSVMVPANCGISTFYNLVCFGPLQGTTPIGGTVALGYGEAVARYRTATASGAVDLCDDCSTIGTTTGPYWAMESPAPSVSTLDPRAPFTGAFAPNNATAWACGRMGLVRRTDDSGVTWEDQGSVLGLRLTGGGDFVDGTTGCVIGQENVIKQTNDGGLTFQVVWPTGSQAPDEGHVGVDLDFSDASDDGLAVGTNGKLLTTDDSGDNWSEVSGTITFDAELAESVEFVPGETTAFLIGRDVVARAVDGGKDASDWTELSLPTSRTGMTFYDVSFLRTGTSGGNPVYTGYAVGQDEVALLSRNGGATWSEVTVDTASSDHDLHSVAAYGDDGQHAIAVGSGGRVFLRESGSAFTRLTIPPPAVTAHDLNDVRVITEVVGSDLVAHYIIGGNHGTVLIGTRTGTGSSATTTWTRPKTQTSEDIVDVPFLATDHAFAIGLQFALCEYE
jgi:photosystem II stability/assembly factor-like uncharacterized protein